MKRSTKDEAQGTLHELKGALKEKAGQIVGNPDMQDEGTVEKVAGQLQQVAGKVEKVVGK